MGKAGSLSPALLLQTFFIALAVTVVVLPRLSRIASRIGLVDHPSLRKVHKTPKPLVGGLGMAIAICFCSLLFIPLAHMRGFFAGMVMLVIVGFLDDFRELNHRWKFVAQVIAALLIIGLSKVSLHTFGDLLPSRSFEFGPYAIPITIFCVVGVINAMNMIDGLDGLAGGLSLSVFVSFAFLSALDNHAECLLLCIALSGALVGFLRYNWQPSRLFMGDAGSLFLGFCAAYVSIATSQEQGSIVRPVAPLLILAVPIVDTVTVMIRRILKGKSPFHADRNHIHHVLIRLGLSKKQSVVVIVALSCLFSVITVVGTIARVADHVLFLVFAAYFVLYFGSSFYISRIRVLRTLVRYRRVFVSKGLLAEEAE